MDKKREWLKVWDNLEYEDQIEFLGLDEETCSICQKNIAENSDHPTGNNANPVNMGRCCDKCNLIVLNARMNRMLVG